MEKLSYKKMGLVGIHIEMIIARNLHWLFHIYLILTVTLHYYNIFILIGIFRVTLVLLLGILTNLVSHQYMYWWGSALWRWGAPGPPAAYQTSCRQQWRNWLRFEFLWESHSAALSADQGNTTWLSPALPRRHRPKTLAGSAKFMQSIIMCVCACICVKTCTHTHQRCLKVWMNSQHLLLPALQQRPTGGLRCCRQEQRGLLCC